MEYFLEHGHHAHLSDMQTQLRHTSRQPPEKIHACILSHNELHAIVWHAIEARVCMARTKQVQRTCHAWVQEPSVYQQVLYDDRWLY